MAKTRYQKQFDYNGKTYTLCERCGRACDSSCSWSDHLEPVPGWTAEETYYPPGKLYSYLVLKCPEYIPDSEEHKAKDLNLDGCVRLMSKAIELARKDYIRYPEMRTRAESFLRDVKGPRLIDSIMADLKEKAAEHDRKREEEERDA